MNVLLLVTLVSLLIAIVMTAIALRASREERRRADARVASLAADIQEAVSASGAATAASVFVPGGATAQARPLRLVPSAAADLFTIAEPSATSSRSVVIVCLGLFLFATVAALAVVFSSGSRATVNPRPAAIDPRAPASEPSLVNPPPLDLVALGQERKEDHLIVRGVITNPPAGALLERLIAVVFVFDADGNFVTSGRATIDSTPLLPGGESAFLVNIPGAEQAARYRVSFRTDTAVIPHLDKRHAS